MKLDIVFCHQCGGNHPPGQHHDKRRRATPDGVPPPPPSSSWEGKSPTRLARQQKLKTPRTIGTPIPVVKPTIPELRAKVRKVQAKKSLKPKAPDFTNSDKSVIPPKVFVPGPKKPNPLTPTRKLKAEYRKKMKLLMRQKRAAKREGMTLEAYRKKYGDEHMPTRIRRQAKSKRPA